MRTSLSSWSCRRRRRIKRPTESKLIGELTLEEAEAIIDGKGPWRLDELSDADGQVLLDALCQTAPDGSVLLDDELRLGATSMGLRMAQSAGGVIWRGRRGGEGG